MGNDFRGIRLVSWDVDGTLFSYVRLTLELLRARPFSVRELRDVWDFHRSVERQRRHESCAVIPAEMERIRQPQLQEKAALEKALRRISPRRRAVSMIQQFVGLGIPQVALSDFECNYKLDALQLNSYFVKAYSCQQVGFWKPSPIPLAQIQNDFGIHPHEHLHIGDRQDTDGESCARNGCRFMLIDSLPKLWGTFNLIVC